MKQTKRGRSNEYPPDNGAPYWHWKWNWVCLDCRTHARRTVFDGIPTCPKCRKPMVSMPRRMRMPKRNDPMWGKACVRYGMVFWPWNRSSR